MLLPLHCSGGAAEASTEFQAVIETCIRTGGCTSSRASVAGACLGALATEAAVPQSWVEATAEGQRVRDLADQLVSLRPSNSAL